jgi:hypothetical protein
MQRKEQIPMSLHFAHNPMTVIVSFPKTQPEILDTKASDDLLYSLYSDYATRGYHEFVSPEVESRYIFADPYVFDSRCLKYPLEDKYNYQKINVIVSRYKKTHDELQREIEMALKQHDIIL